MRIVAHARETAPDECCGLLLGRDDEIVDAVPRAQYRRSCRRRASLSTRKITSTRRREARARGLDVVGFYHSHPASPARAVSARPSPNPPIPVTCTRSSSLQSDPAEVRLFHFAERNFQRLSFVTVR